MAVKKGKRKDVSELSEQEIEFLILLSKHEKYIIAKTLAILEKDKKEAKRKWAIAYQARDVFERERDVFVRQVKPFRQARIAEMISEPLE